MTRKKPQTI